MLNPQNRVHSCHVSSKTLLVFLPFFLFFLLYFLSFFQSLPMIFANIMGLFLGLVSLDRPSPFSSRASLLWKSGSNASSCNICVVINSTQIKFFNLECRMFIFLLIVISLWAFIRINLRSSVLRSKKKSWKP